MQSSTAKDTKYKLRRTIATNGLGFYLDPQFRRKAWDMRKAQNAALNYGIKALLGLAKGTKDDKKKDHVSVMFVVGLGSFNTGTSMAPKHTALTKRLTIRAKSLGSVVPAFHEYKPNAKCPRVNCHERLVSAGRRSRYCQCCIAHFDHDVVGSENIARIGAEQIRVQERPREFIPPTSHP
ncbi:hypothetical protein BG011_005678 [Mortierella polycephala]|uniref:Transposase n=1 Tax=Mortierella polycephala TaxID=41804 RepID=A0A9P6U105_9FUNG|nr:hypothetical protein BG011_005678 [Mortierella polycephala]